MIAVDLFAGCGGLSKGFEQAGFNVCLAIEKWSKAREVYAENFTHPIINLDLSKVLDAINAIKHFEPQIIIGGPPCQEFSIAGDRVEGSKAKLTISFAKIIRGVKPQWFVLENVPRIKNSKAWLEAKKLLTNAGYGITEEVLDAAYYGVPQHRKRFFAIGKLGEKNGFLANGILQDRSGFPLTIREYIGDKLDIEFYYRHPRTWGRKAIFSIDEPSPTIRSTNRPVSPGYKAHTNDAGASNLARHLTASERAMLQTFNTDFIFKGNNTDQEMMIANAVPVNLAKHVGSVIKRYEDALNMLEEPEFREWLKEVHHYTPRTISNVLSRIKRASRLIDVKNLTADPLDAIHALERKPEYVKLTTSVRSQMKKAIRLRSAFYADKSIY